MSADMNNKWKHEFKTFGLSLSQTHLCSFGLWMSQGVPVYLFRWLVRRHVIERKEFCFERQARWDFKHESR